MVGRNRDRVEVLELDERDRQLLARRHPQLSGHRSAIVVASRGDLRRRLVHAIGHVVRTVNEGDRLRLDRVVAMLMPSSDVPSATLLEQARREASMRTGVLRDFGAPRAAELADLVGMRAANRSQLAYRWRSQGRIFAVDVDGAPRYVGFQFDDEWQPRPVVGEVLRELDGDGGLEGWDVVRWFVTPHPLLDLRRPVDLLDDDPDAIVDAAHTDRRRARAGG